MTHAHQWEYSEMVVDTWPQTYHRGCKCGRVEHQFGRDGKWVECFDSGKPR